MKKNNVIVNYVSKRLTRREKETLFEEFFLSLPWEEKISLLVDYAETAQIEKPVLQELVLDL